MALSSFLCIYLMSCISSDAPIDLPECPRNLCQCYKAPKDGSGDDSAISLSCDWSPPKLTGSNGFDKLKSQSINTLAINDFVFDPTRVQDIPIISRLSVNNLELNKCDLSRYESNTKIFRQLDKNNLKVLSFIDSELNNALNESIDWTDFTGFKNLKVFTIKGGQLSKLSNNFKSIAGNKLFSVSIERTGLESIEFNLFKNFIGLKMLTIANNHITSLEWLEIDSPLWYLDLRQNQLTSFPLSVAEKLNHLKILKIGGNKIHVIPSDTAFILMNQLSELTFEIEESGNLVLSDNDYFIPTPDMKWIKEVLSEEKQWSKVSIANYLSIDQANCIKFNRDDLRNCKDLKADDFISVESDQLAVVKTIGNDKEYFLSYNNMNSLLSGAVLPGNWYKTNLTLFFDRVVRAGGNVIKVDLNMQEWARVPTSHSDQFDELIDVLERDVQYIEDNNMFVIINLWEADRIPNQILSTEDVFERYVNFNLKPLVDRLNKYKSVAAWNLIDEPERWVRSLSNSDPCLNTQDLNNPTPVGRFPIDRVQKFIGEQAKIIHEMAPKKLVTITMNQENAQGFTHFEDRCLKKIMIDCPSDSCLLDFYSVKIKSSVELQDYSFRSQDVSSESPKPIVLIVDENFDKITEFYDYDQGFINRGNWEPRGILASFTEFYNDTFNDEIENGIRNLKMSPTIGQRIYGPNDYKSILKG